MPTEGLSLPDSASPPAHPIPRIQIEAVAPVTAGTAHMGAFAVSAPSCPHLSSCLI